MEDSEVKDPSKNGGSNERRNVNERPILRLDKSLLDPIEDKAGQIFATGLGPCLNLRYLTLRPITPIPSPTRNDRFLFYLSVPGHGFSSVHESSSSFSRHFISANLQ